MRLSEDRCPELRKLKLGPWRIDLKRGTVTNDDERSQLVPRTESLFLLLCRHANELVTRDQIHDIVWAGRVVEDTAINHCIWQIRRAIGDKGKDILQTRAKRGYMLIVAEDDWISDPPAQTDAAESVMHSNSGLMYEPQTAAKEPELARPPAPRQYAMHGSLWFWRIAVALACIVFGMLTWRFMHATSSRFVMTPDTQMTVAVIAPDKLEWLRIALLRVAVEHAYLRDSEVVLFHAPQKRNPFVGPHLQIALKTLSDNEVHAELSINQSGVISERQFKGPANGLTGALEKMLMESFGMPSKHPTPATDAFVSGLVAELRFDNQTALAELDRALARDPDLADAKIATARIFLEQGRWRQAYALLDELMRDAYVDERMRCQIEILLADAAPEKIPKKTCERAAGLLKINNLESRDLVRELRVSQNQPKSALQWQLESQLLATAYMRLQELPLAESVFDDTERVARDAGWESVIGELESGQAMLAMYRGKTAEAASLQSQAADRVEALGDIDSALYYRIWSIRAMQIVPGPETERRRRILKGIIARARSIGSVEAELDALEALVRLQRDQPDAWNESNRRMRALATASRTPGALLNDLYKILDETRAMRRYREVLDGAEALEENSGSNTQARIWNLTLRAESHFARDELAAAVDAIDAMQKENFELADTSSICLFSWLFVEARMPDRARIFMKQCQSIEYDRYMQASRGDFGLMAKARQYMLEGQAEKAWPVLKPRIEALTAIREMTRQEAESLTLLARHATSMPGADRAGLQRALTAALATAGKDGAGPGVRIGTHVLRWRLCATAGRSDCGPVLPPWAQEDLLEARLAREPRVGLRVSIER